MSFDLIPLADRVLVELGTGDEKTEGGLYLPENARQSIDIHRGKVVAAGKGRYTEDGRFVAMELQVGDTVLLWPGHTFERDGKKYRLVFEREVLARERGQS